MEVEDCEGDPRWGQRNGRAHNKSAKKHTRNIEHGTATADIGLVRSGPLQNSRTRRTVYE